MAVPACDGARAVLVAADGDWARQPHPNQDFAAMQESQIFFSCPPLGPAWKRRDTPACREWCFGVGS